MYQSFSYGTQSLMVTKPQFKNDTNPNPSGQIKHQIKWWPEIWWSRLFSLPGCKFEPLSELYGCLPTFLRLSKGLVKYVLARHGCIGVHLRLSVERCLLFAVISPPHTSCAENMLTFTVGYGHGDLEFTQVFTVLNKSWKHLHSFIQATVSKH